MSPEASARNEDFWIACVTGTGSQKRTFHRNVTLDWSGALPMEVRCSIQDNDVTITWRLSRDMLVEAADAGCAIRLGLGDVEVATTGPMVWVGLSSPDGHITLAFWAERLGRFLRSTLASCPREAETFDADGLIKQIFQHAEENES